MVNHIINTIKAKDNTETCDAVDPGMMFFCTQPPDHEGDHIATGPRGADGAGPDEEPVYRQWATMPKDDT